LLSAEAAETIVFTSEAVNNFYRVAKSTQQCHYIPTSSHASAVIPFAEATSITQKKCHHLSTPEYGKLSASLKHKLPSDISLVPRRYIYCRPPLVCFRGDADAAADCDDANLKAPPHYL